MSIKKLPLVFCFHILNIAPPPQKNVQKDQSSCAIYFLFGYEAIFIIFNDHTFRNVRIWLLRDLFEFEKPMVQM
ncbi:hypothetical protein H5410_042550 [Solanum commersonii]|uniref:Uncharacterized protein n=1 Tax=Solanum commersonii TaxID=4109 RepID=A0A9J5XXX9_SOLCO|nr:hypothetical protein H5410_042550 [Solanum commersonii]